MAIYEQELENFRSKYNMPKYDLQETGETADMLRGANAFLTGDAVTSGPERQFIRWATRTLSIYFKTNTQANAEAKYMSSFDVKNFLTDFERLVDAKYRSEYGDDAADNRKKYAGASLEDLENAFYEPIKNANKPLPTLWMERLKKGAMDIDQLRAITKNAFDTMDKNWAKDENTMAGSLKNVVAGYEAMKQLRDGRKGFFGWLWKLFNPRINAKEEEYFKELTEQVNKVKDEFNFNVDRISEELTKKTVLGVDVNAKKTAIKTQAKKVEKIEELSTASNVKPKTLDPVANKISQIATEEFFINVAEELHEELPGNGLPQTVRIWNYKQASMGMSDAINTLNEQFDNAVANGGDPKKEMAKVVHGIFKSTVEVFSQYITDEGVDKLEGLKIAAQIITNKLTAAAIYPNELGDVVNEYIEQNSAVYEEIVTGEKNYVEEIGNYQKMLENGGVIEDSREPAFDDEHPFPENNVNKSAPVNSAPQIDVPRLDIN